MAGKELTDLLHRQGNLSEASRREVRTSTLSILSRCVAPTGANVANTGLVVGYVQSGKTLSFTALAAAAHDNGYRVVVVIAGRTKILANQSRNRLLEDLSALSSAARPWVSMHNPAPQDRERLRKLLEGWQVERGRRQTAVITVLKHQGRIRSLANTLRELPPELLGAVLIVDDEADQASLNSLVRKGRQSAVYKAILTLRGACPKHSHLQYTATPQANIFIPLVDLLSPDFCEVLEPGEGYVGGREIFIDRGGDLLCRILDANTVPGVDPPQSLLAALRVFVLGVALGCLRQEISSEFRPPNRSMMVHPSRLVDDHARYLHWILATLRSWSQLLDDPGDPDWTACVEEFRTSYEELLKTCDDCPAFADIADWLKPAIREIHVEQVNSAADVESWGAEWRQHYAWVLVGGQKLDRGFTVEGLTVTYMPRSRGLGLSDTIQQRGRFFGYKRSYIDLCRIYLEPDVLDAFELYVRSEESMRDFLRRHRTPGALKSVEVKRQFQMDRSLKPTRSSILLDPPRHVIFTTGGWFRQSQPHVARSLSDENRVRIDGFIARAGIGVHLCSGGVDWIEDPAKVKKSHIHAATDLFPARLLFEEVLIAIVMSTERDRERWAVALAAIEHWLEQGRGEKTGAIIHMRPELRTTRSTTDTNRIRNLFQGAYPDKRAGVYAGDGAVRRGHLCLQVHSLDLYEGETRTGSTADWPGICAVALWLDKPVREDYIVQGKQS